MPVLPKNHTCEALRCKSERVAGSAYCETHGGKPKQTAQRRENNAPYKTAAWLSMRAAQLSVQPLCQSCKLEGRIVQAAHVDHVIAWRAVGEFAFKRAKLQSLCPHCHSLKTSLEATGIFRHYTEGGAVDYTAQDYARMMREA